MRKFLSAYLTPTFGALILITVATASRLMAPAPNVTLIFGIGIFCGFSFHKNKLLSFLVPVASLFLADCFIGFHSYMWGTYLGTVIAISAGLAAGRRAAKSPSVSSKFIGIFGASLLSSIVFYLISNFHVWIGSGADSLYPQTLSGLIECYLAALPFLKNSLIADSGTAIILLSVTQLVLKYTSPQKLLVNISSKTI